MPSLGGENPYHLLPEPEKIHWYIDKDSLKLPSAETNIAAGPWNGWVSNRSFSFCQGAPISRGDVMLVSGRVPVNAPENRPGTKKERQKVFQADKFPGGYVSFRKGH